MPPSIELNLGRMPAPRRARASDDEGEGAPFRILVLGDFSGRPVAERPALAERRALRVDVDNLEAQFARIAPKVEIAALQDRHGMALKIALESLDDLGADAVLARLPRETVAGLATAQTTAQTAAQAAARASAPTAPSPPSEADAENAAETMRRLLGGQIADDAPARATPPTTPAATAGDCVDRFIRQLVGAHIASPPAPAGEPGPDAAAGALLRHVLRDDAWRRLEGVWRGVDRFVRTLDTADGRVRLDLLDARADELLADIAATGADPARSALAAALAGDGRGCAVVVSLEEFGSSLGELSLLAGLASLAASQGAVLLAGAAPALAALATSEDAAVQAGNESRAWRALRGSALAARIGLTFPRLLARLPYGPRHDPVSALAFDEIEDASGAALHDRLLWRSAALDAALLLAQGVAEAGGLDGAETRSDIDDLPAFIDRSGDEPRLQAVAEAYVGERDVQALQRAGFIALQSDRRAPNARVSGWQSIGEGGAPLAGAWRSP